MAPFELTCEISDVGSEKLCYNACFCEAHRRKISIKMVVPEVVETRDTIKFCVNLGYKQTEMFSLLQRGGVCFRNEKVQCLSGTRGLSKDKKSIQDGPRSGCKKIISGKLVTRYEIWCLYSFPNTTRLGIRPYSKDGLIITRSVSDKMDKILKNYEVLVLCAPAYSYYDKTLKERRHNVKVMACSV